MDFSTPIMPSVHYSECCINVFFVFMTVVLLFESLFSPSTRLHI